MNQSERTRRMMQKYELDALVASTSENVAYTSGYLSSLHPNYATQIYTVIPRDKSLGACLILPTVKLGTAAQMPLRVRDIVSYGPFYIVGLQEDVQLGEVARRVSDMIATVPAKASALEALEEVIGAKGLTRARLGIDEMAFDPSVLATLRSDLPDLKVTYAYNVFRDIQAIKTDDETRLIRTICDMTTKAIEEVLAMASEGAVQRKLVEVFQTSVIHQGASPGHVMIRCGRAGAVPDMATSDYRLKGGDILTWDVGCEYLGYHSDLAGTAVVGRPSAKQGRYYQAVLEGERAALNAIKPGARVADAFHAAVETIRDKGIPHYERNHCGHGIGIETYGVPLVAPESSLSFEVGMVLNVETPYYELGFGSVTVEDTVLVTESGFEYLSTIDRELRIL